MPIRILASFFLGLAAGFLLLLVVDPPATVRRGRTPTPVQEALLSEGEGGATTTLALGPSGYEDARGIRVPILVYHIVRPSYPSDSAAVKRIAVTPQVFDREMAYLREAGYRVVPFSALEDYLYHGTPLPPRPVILTFDDGWEDQYLYAFPILEKYRYTATFFVPTNFPGHKGFLTWDQVRVLAESGMTIGDHTKSHPYLTRITSTSTLWDEIAGSKQILQQELGTTVTEFDYPFGAFNASIVAMVKAAGYKVARADALSPPHSKDNPYALGALNAPTNLPVFESYFPR